ncbi:MAG: cytochrome b/b6 domain-containing protein [Rubrivivax sp.]|nr:cytochrome b/b6 domain-containing protein [Rubrivivax sp.]
MPPAEPLVPVRVWDLPTRAFHWLLAATIVGSVVSAKIGGNAMVWHFRFGYLVFGLLAFRLLWGFVGGCWSRFASFIYAPATLLRYLRGRSQPGEHLDVGHNPLGSLSVLAMLGVLALQVGTGLVADDEIANLGPLSRFVSNDTALSATSWHKSWGQWIVLALVLTHIAAIVFYLWRRNVNLVRPMWAGDKPLVASTPAAADHGRSRLLALVLATLCAAAVTMIVRLGG